MHIKTITIAGFKSYRDQRFDAPFSARHNVFVGKNGSGKSNFFNAILFVLSEKYSTLRPNERTDLLHAGAGSPSLTAYVEITFDNSDGRLVIPGSSEDTEVRIRRTVGAQKDEFRINDKGVSAADVRQLLEAAGFSASNPYYVVEQGRIVSLANMGEVDRLELLKDVAGTKVYEERRAESLRILEETEEKRAKIEETIGKLRSRLSELESEREEWKRYQTLEKRRKGLEHTLYSQEANKLQHELDTLEKSKKELAGNYEEFLLKTNQLRSETKTAERDASDITRQIQSLERERKVVEAERVDLLRQRAKIDVALQDVRGAVEGSEGERKKLEKELADITKALEKGKKDHEAKAKQMGTKSTAAEGAEAKLITLETRMNQLQAKRGRRRAFKTKQERDKWLREEIAKNDEIVANHKKELTKIGEQEKQIEAELKKDEAAATAHATGATRNDAEIANKEESRLEALKKRDDLHAQRRSLFQNINEVENKLRRLTEEKDRMQGQLDKAMGSHEIRQGLASVEAVLRELGEKDKTLRKAVHGPVIDLMKCDPRFFTAVEVTVGNALYNVIVDSFETSAKILDYMNKNKKSGRVTFLPLDTCHGTKKDIPTSKDITPLISHIEFSEKFKGVFHELFGRTAVAGNLQSAAEASKQYDCDAVTLDGDQINRKGGIHGGFMHRASRLQTYSDHKKAAGDCTAISTSLQDLKKSLADVEQQMAVVVQSLENAAGQGTSLREAAEEERRTVRQAHDRIARHQQQLTKLRESKTAVSHALTEASETVKVLTAEIDSDFKATFGDDEERELERLLSQVDVERAETSKRRSDAVNLATDLQVLESNLATLQKRADAIAERIAVLSHATVHVDNQHLSVEDKSIATDLQKLDARLNKMDTEITALMKQKQKVEEKAQEYHSQEATMSRAFHSEKEEIDKYNARRTLLSQQLEDAHQKIRRLGAVPTDAAQYEGMPAGKIMQQLKQCGEELRAFAHVNKKAFEQYQALAEGYEDLLAKQKTNEKELSAIHEMMNKLDSQKDEAIERTVKQVQFQFAEVFKELVAASGASAELQLLKSKESAKKSGVEAYVGVRIKVCFGLGTPVTELTQLSGGQKSLVALSLIFAIQRCDPAPFYVFDEIDAALDADYRTTVAKLIQRQSDKAQFITATFKHEMLEVSDKVYGIAFRNRVSRIQEITQDEGHALLRQAAAEKKRDREGDE